MEEPQPMAADHRQIDNALPMFNNGTQLVVEPIGNTQASPQCAYHNLIQGKTSLEPPFKATSLRLSSRVPGTMGQATIEALLATVQAEPALGAITGPRDDHQGPGSRRLAAYQTPGRSRYLVCSM